MSDVEKPTRKIIHVDMDCFYAAVEVKHDPRLKGKPIAVGGPANSRAVLTTASYEARRFGVRSAMPSSQAMRLCPQLIIVPPNFERYRAESHAVREIFRRFTEQVEPLSLDEAYLDVSNCPQFSGSATLIAREIRSLIHRETGLTASAGIAPNKFLAKIASDWNKPNGQFVIRPQDIEAFMPSLKVEKIHGVGQVTAKKMQELGLLVCGDIQKTSAAQMASWFGSRGPELRDRAFGIDHREVEPHQERKSLTVEETYEQDLQTVQDCLERLPGLYADWERGMTKANLKDRISGIVVKLKFHDFKTTTHEMSLKGWPVPEHFEKLLATAWERRSEPVRLIGIGARLLTSQTQDKANQLKFEFESSSSS